MVLVRLEFCWNFACGTFCSVTHPDDLVSNPRPLGRLTAPLTTPSEIGCTSNRDICNYSVYFTMYNGRKKVATKAKEITFINYETFFDRV